VPGNNAYVNAMPQLTGTAQDYPLSNPGTISAVAVRLERLSDGDYWNGSGAWTINQTVFTLGVLQGVNVYVSSWSVTNANLPVGNDLKR